MKSTSAVMRLTFLSALFLLVLPVVCMGAPNLVVNGDFELGITGFVSDYTYSPSTNSTESQYTVRTDPYPWNGFFVSRSDHTTGTGMMFVGNGDPVPNSIVWQSAVPVAVVPNTNYYFEAWAMNVCCYEGFTGPNSPAVLEFSVVGAQTESLGIIPTSLPAGTWQFLGTTWNSGANTSVVLQIVNQNTAVGGNDFALDDIHFSTTSSIPEPTGTALVVVSLLTVTCSRRPRFG